MENKDMSSDETSVTTTDPGFWREVWQQAQLVWRLIRDPQIPFYLKLVPLAAVVYVIFPLDLLPDIWPVLGQLDDLTALLVGAKVFIELSPQEIVDHHLRALRRSDPSAASEGDVANSIVIDADYEVKGNKKDRAS